MSDQNVQGLDISVFLEVIENGDAAARISLAAQLARFLGDEDVPETERLQAVPAVLKLAVDPVTEVRRTLINGVTDLPRLHPDIVFSIIADEDELALPFLAVTPALTSWHMMAILRVGDVARQTEVVMRPDVTPEVVTYAAKSSSIEVCLAMLDNAKAPLGDDSYRMLYTRFGQSPEMVEQLLARPDLPLDIRILQAKRASNRMHQLMAERGWIAANDAAELVADAEETAILRILVEASDDELASVIPFLIAKGMLTPSIIVRAAALGEMHVVIWSLAHLGGTTPARAREQMAGRSLLGFKSLHAKSGLPQSCFGLLRASFDVAQEARDEGIRLEAEAFGRRLIEALMTRYETMPTQERAKHLEFLARFAEDRVRVIARRLRADMVRAA